MRNNLICDLVVITKLKADKRQRVLQTHKPLYLCTFLSLAQDAALRAAPEGLAAPNARGPPRPGLRGRRLREDTGGVWLHWVVEIRCRECKTFCLL